MTHRIVRTTLGTIEYSENGSGIPLLFVHGGHSSCNETLFHKGFDPARFRILTPSRPGYGNTPLASFQTPQAAADLLFSLVEYLSIDSVIVIGISAGGLTAIALAAQYPERVKKLILISAVTQRWLTDADANYRKGKILFSPQLEWLSWGMFRLGYVLFPHLMASTMFSELSSKTPISILDDEIQEFHSMISNQRSGNGFVNDLDQEIDPGALSHITAPALILHSINDQVVPMAHAEHAHQHLVDAELRTFDNRWGHLLWLGDESRAPIETALNFIR